MEIDIDEFEIEEPSDYDSEILSEHDTEIEDEFLISNIKVEDEDTTEALSSVSSNAKPVIDLQTCLDCNLQYQEMLSHVITELEIALEKNLSRQEELQEEIDEYSGGSSTTASGRRKAFCYQPYPYFQDKDKMVAPLNEDAKAKERCEHRDSSNFFPFPNWTRVEEKNLCEAVEKSARKSLLEPLMERKEIVSQKLIISRDPAEREALTEKLEEVNNELQEIKEISANTLFSLKVRIDWLTIANINMRNNRMPEAYELRWTNHLHPNINKKPWTKAEDKLLMKTAQEYNNSYWYKIANELQTNRTALECCRRFHCNISPSIQLGVWSEAEKKMLTDVVEMCRYGNFVSWVQVHYYIEGRTMNSLRAYWFQKINPMIKKGFFTKEEDFLLLAAVKKYGNTRNWDDIVECFGGTRTSIQLRYRYNTCLCKSIMFRKFTGEEDRKIVSLVQEKGKSWAVISKQMPGRTQQMLSERYKNILCHNPDLEKTLRTTDPSKPLAPTHNSHLCEKYRDKLNGHFEQRCAAYMQKKRLFKRNTLKKFYSPKRNAVPPVEEVDEAVRLSMVLKEALTIFKNQGKSRESVCKAVIAKRQATKTAQGELTSILKTHVHLQPPKRQKYVSLVGKKLVQHSMMEKTFCQVLNVPVVQCEDDEEVKSSAHCVGVAQTLESCLGLSDGNIGILPPNQSTTDGFRLLLSDLKRLATSASSLTDSQNVTQLTQDGFIPKCLGCDAALEKMPVCADHKSSSVDDVVASDDCQECVRTNRINARFALLRNQFVSLFFWPALLSTVEPPSVPLVENGNSDSAKNNLISQPGPALKEKRPTPEDGAISSKEKPQKKENSVPRKKRTRKSSSLATPVRKSSRLADKTT